MTKKSVVQPLAWPNPAYAWYVVLVLTFANTVSFIDRQILSLLVEPIRTDLGLNDTQVSLLHGFAFVIFYTIMGIPIARLADRGNRKWVIIIGATLWSAMTAVCGLAKTFWGIFSARMGVGVGEATLSPSAHSMMSDYFPPEKLSFPMGVYMAGVTTGMGIALLAGAAVIDAVETWGTLTLPGIGPLAPWQTTFVVVGAIGIPVVVLMATVREPIRRGRITAGNTDKTPASLPIRQVARYFGANWRTYATVYGGFTMTSVGAYGLAAWTPTFYIRSYGLGASEAGYLIGVVIVLGGLGGSLAGGWLADWLAARGVRNAKIWVMWIGAWMLIPPGLIAPLMPTPLGAASLLGCTFFVGSMAAGPAASVAQEITPNQMRAQASALYLFLSNLIGLGLGPTAIALFTDYVFADPQMVRYSLIAVVAIFNPIAVVLIGMSFGPYRRTVDNVHALTSSATREGDRV